MRTFSLNEKKNSRHSVRRQTAAQSEPNHFPVNSLQRSLGNRQSTSLLQAKLKVGGVNDPLERQADRAAESVLRGNNDPDSNSQINMRTSDSGLLQRRAEHDSTASGHNRLAKNGLHLNAGQPLPEYNRVFFERGFARDFRNVRVHTGDAAAESARVLQARAYTLGSDIVFGAGEFNPGTSAGKQLLAHELVHVVQQREQPITALQRRPVTWSDKTSVAQYEWTGTEQKITNKRINQAFIGVSYNSATGDLTCTFKLKWRFPAAWKQTRRTKYKSDFESTVKAAWENKFPLVKWENNKPAGTTAKVLINFDSIDAPDIDDDTEYIKWLMTPAGAATKERWTMNVHPSPLYRDKVDYPNVHLDSNANSPEQTNTSAYKDRTYTSDSGGSVIPPPYQHYFDLGITPSQGSAKGGKYSQTAAVHEFGHMIGLADEYVMSAEDYAKEKRRTSKKEANAELKKRAKATDRVQNLGNNVTKDSYRPFANFLHELMAEDWRVK